MRRMLRKILPESHLFQHHLLVYLRSIEQMKPVLLPYSDTEMGDGESLLFTCNSYYVAILHRLPHSRRVLNSRLGYISVFSSAISLFHLGYAIHQSWIIPQRLVTVRMSAHISQLYCLHSRKRRIGLLPFCHYSLARVVIYPFCKIMQSRHISCIAPVPIPYYIKIILIILKRPITSFECTSQCHYIFHQSGAVKLACVYH